MCTLKVYSQGWTSFDFRAVNALGDTIPYLYTQGDSTSLTVSQMINQTSWYKTDSLVIPEIVTQDNKNYIVKKNIHMVFRKWTGTCKKTPSA